MSAATASSRTHSQRCATRCRCSGFRFRPILNISIAAAGRVGDRSPPPTMCSLRENIEAGGLISYGQALPNIRQAGVYVGHTLKGEKPADFPVIQSTKFEFVLNLRPPISWPQSNSSTDRACRRGDRIECFRCNAWILLAESGRGRAAMHMSAFGGKADMTFLRCTCPLLALMRSSALGALHMSAFDPKRTFARLEAPTPFGVLPRVDTILPVLSPGGGNETARIHHIGGQSQPLAASCARTAGDHARGWLPQRHVARRRRT